MTKLRELFRRNASDTSIQAAESIDVGKLEGMVGGFTSGGRGGAVAALIPAAKSGLKSACRDCVTV